MQRQFEILNELAQILHDEADPAQEGISYKGEVNVEEGWMESTFSYRVNGEKKSVHLSDDAEDQLSALVLELHKVMLGHTSGNWKWFTFELDAAGKAKVHFEY